MEHNRSQKLLMIIALVAGIASLTVGFAAFSVSLNISSSASVTPSSDTFTVKFSTNKDSLAVGAVTPSSKTTGITTTDGVIDNGTNPTIKNLSATFTTPGQYVEYTFYARNEGEYTAYLNNINFLGDKTCTGETGATASLVTSACESINISATIGNTTYTETTPIEGHTLAKGVGEQIKIRLEYLSTGTAVDGAFSIEFPNVALVYSTLDDSSIEPTLPTKVVRLVSGDLNTPGSIVAIGDEQFYTIGTEGENVKLLSVMNITLGDNPIQSSSAGVPQFSDTNYWTSTVSSYPTYVYDSNSRLYSYVENYKTYLSTLGVTPSEARLITYEELTDLGCSGSSCSGAPSWIYATRYWTGSAADTNNVWNVNVTASFGANYYSYFGVYGVRPVIEISVSEF